MDSTLTDVAPARSGRPCFAVLVQANRLSRWPTIARILMLAGLTLGSAACDRDAVPKPNVVWIVLDACRADHLSSYGYRRETSPNIDRLAKSGALFEENFSQAPNTLLSVPSYFTGRYVPALYQDPHHLGIWFLRQPLPDEKLASTIFSANGYVTAAFSGSPWYSARSRLGRSFDDFVRLEREDDLSAVSFASLNQRAFDWLEGHANDRFFLYLHAMDTHSPHPEGYTDDRWLNDSLSADRKRHLRLWDSAKLLEDGQTFTVEEQEFLEGLYDGSLRVADAGVGALINKLESLALMESTVIVISSDHGELTGRDGLTVGHPSRSRYDELFHVPLVLSGPGVPAGRRIQAMTENADILPTLVDLAKLSTDARFDGTSLYPLVSGTTDRSPHEYLFARIESFVLPDEPLRIYSAPDHKAVVGPGKQHGRIAYRRPDRVDTRRVLEQPGLLAAAERYDTDHFLPLWRAHERSAQEVPQFFVLPIPWKWLPTDQVARVELPTDGLWGILEGGGTRMVGGAVFAQAWILAARPYLENVAKVAVHLRAPPGRFRVEAFLPILRGEHPPRDSSIEIRAGDGHEFTRYDVRADVSADEGGGRWIELGTFDVADAGFRFVVRPGARDANAAIGSFRFTDVKSVAASAEPIDLDREREMLRSLGYTD
jgi:arylsulfatase A-like enzyme